MSGEFKFEEIKKNRCYKISLLDHIFVALKLEGFKSGELSGVLSYIGIKAGHKGEEENNWFVIVKDRNDIVLPYSEWENKVREVITEASGSIPSSITIASSISPYDSIIAHNATELQQAYAEGWGEPYQFATGQWILRRPKR